MKANKHLVQISINNILMYYNLIIQLIKPEKC